MKIMKNLSFLACKANNNGKYGAAIDVASTFGRSDLRATHLICGSSWKLFVVYNIYVEIPPEAFSTKILPSPLFKASLFVWKVCLLNSFWLVCILADKLLTFPHDFSLNFGWKMYHFLD